MDTNNKDSMKYRDIDLDMFDIEEEPDAKSEAFTAVSIPPDREKNSRFPRPKMVLIGGVVLLLIAGLVYFLTDYVEKNLISKEDTVIIQYQLGQINEKLEKDAAEKEGVEKAFSSEFSKLSERIDNLEAKINLLNNKNPEDIITRQFDQIASRIDGIEEKINALSKNETTMTEKHYYKVRRNETLFAIARKHDITVKELCALNNISPKQKIYPGQRLVVRPPLVK
jgi:tetrahydromethanopterin S-methyltransferase subunit G